MHTKLAFRVTKDSPERTSNSSKGVPKTKPVSLKGQESPLTLIDFPEKTSNLNSTSQKCPLARIQLLREVPELETDFSKKSLKPISTFQKCPLTQIRLPREVPKPESDF